THLPTCGPCPGVGGARSPYRSASHHLGPRAADAAGQRLAHTPLPRATRTSTAVLADALLGFRERREPRPAAAHGGGDPLRVEPVVMPPQRLRAVIHMLIRDSEDFEIDSGTALGQQLSDRGAEATGDHVLFDGHE